MERSEHRPQPRTQAAELAARRNGYQHAWPPPPAPRVETPEEMRAVLARLSAGELSAHVVAAAGYHLMSFFATIPPELFYTTCQNLVDIVLWNPDQVHPLGWNEPPTVRVRIRAVQSVIKPLLKVLELLPKLKRLQDPSPMVQQLLASLYAFLEPLGGGKMGEIAAALMLLANSSRSPDTTVRATAAAADLTLAALTTVINAGLGLERAAGVELSAAQRAEIEAGWQAMMAKARDKLRAPQPAESEHAAVAG